jgi:hypothetical protein
MKRSLRRIGRKKAGRMADEAKAKGQKSFLRR